MKNNELINLLEEKYMADDTINVVLKYVMVHDNTDIIKTINNIYDIFSYAGLNNDQIELLIKKNVRILNSSKSEMLKLACVLQEVNLNDEIFSKPTIVSGITNYKRVFMRDFISKISEKRAYRKGVDFLTTSDNMAYSSKYNLNECCDVIQRGIFCDEDLEAALNKHLKFKGKPISVEEYLNKMAVNFYIKFMIDNKNKKTKTNGINVK